MSTTSRPQKKMQDKSPIEELSGMYEAMLPKEFGGAVNLFIHPMAGAAAMSAIGFGIASQAMGMWLGAVAGATGASQRMLEGPGADAAEPKGGARQAPKLSLVSSKDLAAAAPIAPAVPSDVGSTAGAILDTAQRAAEDAVKRAEVSAASAAKWPSSRVAPPANARKAAKAPRAPAAVVAEAPRSARPAGSPRPESPDDLKAISGIGPKLEEVLNGLGIWTYGQLAALSEAELGWLDDHLGFSGRIARDDWTGQARKLAGGK